MAKPTIQNYTQYAKISLHMNDMYSVIESILSIYDGQLYIGLVFLEMNQSKSPRIC